MKNIRTYLFALLAITFVISSCDEDEDLIAQRKADNPLPSAPTGDAGSLDVSNYIAIGNSLSAGFMDAALYTDGQENSFPNMLATQFMISGIGGGTFEQPDINSLNGYSGMGPNSSILGRLELSLSQQRPVPTAGELPGAFGGDKAGLNNLSVPGMRLVDINDPALAARNGLYARFATAPGTSTVLGQAIAASPTFFSYWLGSNDMLGYALAGGTNEAMITDAGSFQTELTNSLGALVATGAKGVVINLPPVVLAPTFRAVPYNPVALDQTSADNLNAGFSAYNQALAGLKTLTDNSVPGVNVSQADVDQRSVSYSAGANPVLMNDDDLVDYNRPGGEFDIMLALTFITPAQREALRPYGQTRPATSNDLIPLSTVAAGEIGRVIGDNPLTVSGVSIPIADQFVLSQQEVVRVVTARATYNAIIDGVVAGINANAGATVITVVDVQPTFADVFGLSGALATQLALSQAAIAAADGELGIEIEGQTLRPDFGPNGVFSADGVHPNPRGHAIIANLVIEAMNTTFGADIPRISVLPKRGIIATD